MAAAAGDPGGAPRTAETSPPAGFVPTAEERAACARKEGVKLDSLACLVAARKRAWANDAAGAKALLDLGCNEGDIDACLDLRAAEPSRAAAIDASVDATCGGLGPLGKKLVACLRGRTKDVFEREGLPAKLPLALALDLRAAHGPRLLAVLDAARAACKASASGAKVASLARTPIEKDDVFLDAGILCEGRRTPDADAARAIRDGETMSNEAVPRSLHDAIPSNIDTLHMVSSAGPVSVGVWCPSRLLDDDHAADVWAAVKGEGGAIRIVGSIRIAEPCRNATAVADRAKERALVSKAFTPPVEALVTGALDKLARRCDDGLVALETKKSPLAGDPIENSSAILSFEPHCVYGYRGFTFASPKPLNYPSQITTITDVMQVSGRAMRVQAIKEMPDRLELTLRRRDAELVVALKRP